MIEEEYVFAPERHPDYNELFDAAIAGDVVRIEAVLNKGLNLNALKAHSYGAGSVEDESDEDNSDEWEIDSEEANAYKAESDEADSLGIDPRFEVGESNEGLAAIHLAARHGHTETLRLVLARGADVNLRSHDEETALNYAAYKAQTPAVKLLLDAGADINLWSRASRDELYTSLFSVLRNKIRITPEAIEVIELFLDRGFDIDASLGEFGMREKYCPNLMTMAAVLNSLELTQRLLARGACLPDDVLSKTHDYEIVDLLLSRGAKVTHESSEDSSGIATAAYAGNLKTLQLLVSQAGELDLKRAGKALVVAASTGRLDIVDLLLDHGFDINMVVDDLAWKTPLSAACRGEVCHNRSPPDERMVRKLLARGADISLQDHQGNTALHTATCGSLSIVMPTIIQILLDAGASASIQNKDWDTPLIRMVRGFYFLGRRDIDTSLKSLEKILQQPCGLNIQNNAGNTALHTLFMWNRKMPSQFEGARRLIESGADVSLRNKDGKTAADLVTEGDRDHILHDYLLDNHPTPTIG
ncbi:MAG: hypothetical protein Q9226_005384 [Calogaya cf. arnoldii]